MKNISNRLEIIIERSFTHHLLSRLTKSGASGYTVIPASESRGTHGEKENHDLSGVFETDVVICLMSPERTSLFLEEHGSWILSIQAVLSVCDISVLRKDRF